jgi:hypothetical protein
VAVFWITYREAVDEKGKTLKPHLSLLLAGVAYWQTFQPPKLLKLHGPKSIYETPGLTAFRLRRIQMSRRLADEPQELND